MVLELFRLLEAPAVAELLSGIRAIAVRLMSSPVGDAGSSPGKERIAVIDGVG